MDLNSLFLNREERKKTYREGGEVNKEIKKKERNKERKRKELIETDR